MSDQDIKKMEILHSWDGTCGTRKLDDMRMADELLQDDDGTVYYVSKEREPKLRIWCPAVDLARHIHYLNQLLARR